VAVTQELFFNSVNILNNLSIMPGFFSDIWIYLIFIVAVEFFLRILDIIFIAFDLHSDEEVKKED